MTFWIDAQLPPLLAAWLTAQFGVEAANLESLGLRHAQDIEIFRQACKPGHVIMTKDEDFVDIVTRLGPPPQILWVRQRDQQGSARVAHAGLSCSPQAPGNW